MSDYDVCIIGAGPAGFAAAMRAWDFGKRVCLIERGQLGGTGIHNGALSSKTLWELSLDYRNALRSDRGFTAERVRVDFGQVVRCVRQAAEEKVGQMRTQLEALSRPCDGHEGTLTLLRGSASFVDPHRVSIDQCDGGSERVVSADNVVIATGSRPRILPDIAIDGDHIMTSDHVMGIGRFPRSMVILGAGVVGCEFATIFDTA